MEVFCIFLKLSILLPPPTLPSHDDADKKKSNPIASLLPLIINHSSLSDCIDLETSLQHILIFANIIITCPAGEAIGVVPPQRPMPMIPKPLIIVPPTIIHVFKQ